MKTNAPATELQTSATPPAAEAPAAQERVLDEPAVGGSFLRDPVTGELTPNVPKE